MTAFVNKTVEIHKRLFAIVSDCGYYPGLYALLNSIHTYHGDGIPVHVARPRPAVRPPPAARPPAVLPQVHRSQVRPRPPAFLLKLLLVGRADNARLRAKQQLEVH